MIKKWWLKNPAISELNLLSDAVWNYMAGLVAPLGDMVHFGTMLPTMVDQYWQKLPLKPKLAAGNQANFLRQFEQYLERYGSDQGVALTQDIFGLTDFEVVVMRHTPLADRYAHVVVRLWIDAATADETFDQIATYLTFVLPARCTKHFQLVRRHTGAGFGRTQFGRRYGK